LEAFVDAALEEIPRPEDKQKKKRHSVKTQTKNNKNMLIAHISRSVEGKKHDYALFKEQPPLFPKRLINILIWDTME